MKTKTMIMLALGGIVVYFLFLKPAAPKPTGAGAVLTDLGKLVGDFSGNAA